MFVFYMSVSVREPNITNNEHAGLRFLYFRGLADFARASPFPRGGGGEELAVVMITPTRDKAIVEVVGGGGPPPPCGRGNAEESEFACPTCRSACAVLTAAPRIAVEVPKVGCATDVEPSKVKKELLPSSVLA